MKMKKKNWGYLKKERNEGKMKMKGGFGGSWFSEKCCNACKYIISCLGS